VPVLVIKALHEDLWVEYKSTLDDIFRELHGRKKSHNLKFELPRKFEIPE